MGLRGPCDRLLARFAHASEPLETAGTRGTEADDSVDNFVAAGYYQANRWACL